MLSFWDACFVHMRGIGGGNWGRGGPPHLIRAGTGVEKCVYGRTWDKHEHKVLSDALWVFISVELRIGVHIRKALCMRIGRVGCALELRSSC
jgi:hypothetical protein